MTEQLPDDGSGFDYGLSHPSHGIGLPAFLRDLPNHVHRMYWELYEQAFAGTRHVGVASMRAKQYFLEGKEYAEFIHYPCSHPSKPVAHWLRRCRFCGEEFKTSDEFRHKPGCPVERVRRGEADPEELLHM